MSPPNRTAIVEGYPIVVAHPLADLRIEYGSPRGGPPDDRLTLAAYDEGEAFLDGGRQEASVGDVCLNTDQVRAVRDWCDAWLTLYGERHHCEVPGGWQPYTCTEDENGRFYAGEETVVCVDFCPLCGMRAPTPSGKERAT